MKGVYVFFSSRRRHTRSKRDWSSDVCSSDLQLHGSWADAADAAQRAYQRSLLSTDHAAGGGAHYVLGEVHRLRGDFVLAEQAYREASRLGREPQPGLALLRLVQGQVEAAASTLRRV